MLACPATTSLAVGLTATATALSKFLAKSVVTRPRSRLVSGTPVICVPHEAEVVLRVLTRVFHHHHDAPVGPHRDAERFVQDAAVEGQGDLATGPERAVEAPSVV